MSDINFTVRLHGQSADILEKVVKKGYSESKTEAVRMGLILLGIQLGLTSKESLLDESLGKMKSKGYHYTEDEIMKQLEEIR